MEKYDVIIIGAGIGGLTCGCYLTELGLKVLIVEQHHVPGGYCTSFTRKQFRFDAAVHYFGSVKRGTLGKILKELSIENEIKFKQFDPTDKIIMPENITYIRANPFDTLTEFKKSFPKEKNNIDRFFSDILEKTILTIRSKINKLTFGGLLDNYFSDFRLKATLSSLLANMGSSPSRISALAGVIFFKEFILDPGYYPSGGTSVFPDVLVKKIKNNKGEVILSQKVSSIIVEDGKANGVLLENGVKIKSRLVVSNADATFTYKNLLTSNTKESSVVDKMKASSSAMGLYIGLNIDLTSMIKEECNLWYCNSYEIDKLLSSFRENISKKELPFILVFFPSLHDPSIKTKSDTIQALINASFESKEFWKVNKREIMTKMLNLTKRLVPGLKDEHISVLDGATPQTFYKYTLNHNGAIYGWESSLEQIDPNLIPQNSSLDGLILTGHWCTSGIGGEGGISGVATLGRNAARIAANYLKKNWPWEIIILK